MSRVILDYDHQLNIRPFRQAGGEKLVESLLRQAGILDGEPWRLRVLRPFHCSGDTPPLAIKSADAHGIQMRIKPGDNSTGMLCNLVVGRRGHSATRVRELLAGATGAPSRAATYDPVTELQAMREDHGFLPLALEAVALVEQDPGVADVAEFAEAVCREFGPDGEPSRWQAILAGLRDCGLLSERRQGGLVTGYRISDAGRQASTGLLSVDDALTVLPPRTAQTRSTDAPAPAPATPEPAPVTLPQQPVPIPAAALAAAPVAAPVAAGPELLASQVDQLALQADALVEAGNALRKLSGVRRELESLRQQIAHLREMEAVFQTEESDLLGHIKGPLLPLLELLGLQRAS